MDNVREPLYIIHEEVAEDEQYETWIEYPREEEEQVKNCGFKKCSACGEKEEE